MAFSKLTINRRPDFGASVLLFLCLCCGLTYVLPNHGGAGLNLPQNLLTWVFMALISLWCIYHSPSGNKITLPTGSWLLIAGVILWSLPLLWTPRADWRLNALPKVIALWGMLAFYFLLLCTTSCNRLRSRWLLILVLAALMQAGYGLWQFAHLDELAGGRPYGSFQQVNVLASFIATGLVCALWLFLQQGSPRRRLITAVALVVLPAMLVILQSRAGKLGAASGVLLLILLMLGNKKHKAARSLLLMAVGVGMGMVALHLAHSLFPNLIILIDKEGTTLSRLYILKLTWKLIELHPFVGNGYGSFEALYGQISQSIPPGLGSVTMLYPHNEFLYAWVEGGLVAMAGILLMVAGIFRRLWSTGGARFVGVALLLPIAVHMNLEYPLYQSITHGLTLIMLLVVCGSAAVKEDAPEKRYLVWRGVVGIIALAVLAFMVTGIQTQQRLTGIEQQGLMPLVFNEQAAIDSLLNPYSQSVRVDFDRHVALLLRFNQTHDLALLDEFRRWAKQYLLVHNDPSVYASLLMIAQAQNLPEANTLCRKAKAMWLEDQRFNCTPPTNIEFQKNE